MADVHTRAQRSYNMSRIRSRDTRPELLVRRHLHRLGYRYRLHPPGLPGRPDLVLPRHRTIIFVHGCFWHGHPGCSRFKMPATNTAWWATKIARTQALDAQAQTILRRQGWLVRTLWECDLLKDRLPGTLRQLVANIEAAGVR